MSLQAHSWKRHCRKVCSPTRNLLSLHRLTQQSLHQTTYFQTSPLRFLPQFPPLLTHLLPRRLSPILPLSFAGLRPACAWDLYHHGESLAWKQLWSTLKVDQRISSLLYCLYFSKLVACWAPFSTGSTTCLRPHSLRCHLQTIDRQRAQCPLPLECRLACHLCLADLSYHNQALPHSEFASPPS